MSLQLPSAIFNRIVSRLPRRPSPTPSTQTRVLFSIATATATKEVNTTINKPVTILNKGNDTLEISRVINGMWQTSGGWGTIDVDAAVDAMLRYVDAGLTTFDMSNHYGPAEDIYGIFIDRLRRERSPELFKTVKGLTKLVVSPGNEKITGAYVRECIDKSRKRMNVGCLDMLQLHWWDYSNTSYLDALKHLTDLKEEGKIKTIGLTNFDTERLQLILENKIPIVSNQIQYSVIDTRPQQKMVKLCQRNGIKLLTYGTVMGGLLTEKMLDTVTASPSGTPPLSTPSHHKYAKMVEAWGGWTLFRTLLQTLKTISVKHRVSIPTVAVRYILDQPCVAGSMVGVRLGLSEHIQDCNAIFYLTLDQEDFDCIQAITQQGNDLISLIGDCGNEIRTA